MSLRIHGISASRAFRSIWAAEEVGVPFEHVPTTFHDDSKSPAHLAVNPNGRIPALEDGEFHLFESMAINLYLAKQHGAPGFYPDNPQGEARTWQWSVWGISEIEPLQMQIVIQRLFMPKDKVDEGVVARAEKGLARPLQVLDDALAGSSYLLGDEFTIADLNLAAVMDLFSMIAFDTTPWPNVNRWLTACQGRESFARAKARD